MDEEGKGKVVIGIAKRAEWLVEAAAILIIIYFGWAFIEKAVLWPWQERQGRVNAEQRLQQCQTELSQVKK